MENGSLLAISTLSAIKTFHLKEVGLVDYIIRPRKLDIPGNVASIGARIVQFSPDGKWLLIVTSNNKIQLIRIVLAENLKDTPRFLPQPITLRRLPRKIPNTNYLHGSLGAYGRSVCRIAFSADSRILAVGDLSGHLDTFVLEGHEDLTQDPPITTPNDDAGSSSSSSSSSSSESDSEACPSLVYAQHWRRNPTAHLIPKLPAVPLLLSFRPAYSPDSASNAHTNGTTTHVLPTRHNPHPHSHDLPKGEDRLFILTAEHQLYEFDILAGKISDWSRRNPTSMLPRDFRKLRDRTMGCVWDVARLSLSAGPRERIWLYGSTWLWMLDLAQDLPKPNPEEQEEEADLGTNQTFEANETRKRRKENKRLLTQDDDDGPLHKRRKKQRDTGAGSKMPTHELHTGVGRSFRRTTGSEGQDAKLLPLDHRVDDTGSDDDEVEQQDVLSLVQLRREGRDNLVENDVQNGEGQGQSPPYWKTYKYRPILGIVPIRTGAGDEDGEEDERRGVEVALVERPIFDVDLPGRYYGDQEWSEKKDEGEQMR